MTLQTLCISVHFIAKRAGDTLSFFMYLLYMAFQSLFTAENFIAKLAFDFPHGFPLVLVPESRIILHIARIAVKVARFF